MTTELTMLAWTLALAVVYIIAFDVVRTRQYGTKWNMGARDETVAPLSPVANRLGRAQANLFETLPLFIGAVLVAHAAGISTSRTVLGSELYFWARVAYLPLYAFGVP
ncbi:MAG: MAPEG family protein, partial [Janthinobacterium lividum]